MVTIIMTTQMMVTMLVTITKDSHDNISAHMSQCIAIKNFGGGIPDYSQSGGYGIHVKYEMV